MTINQAKKASDLLEQLKDVQNIQKSIRAAKYLVIEVRTCGSTTIPEEAMPFIQEALIKAEQVIKDKITEL